jgi:hypothetical protein
MLERLSLEDNFWRKAGHTQENTPTRNVIRNKESYRLVLAMFHNA